MPWQGDLFIGEPVKTEQEALAIYERLGIDPSTEDVFDGRGGEKFVTFKGRSIRVYVYAMHESETDERAVAFSLTGRYKGEVLDVDCTHSDGRPAGRPNQFAFDPQDLMDLLKQVQEWWPQATVILWDRFH